MMRLYVTLKSLVDKVFWPRRARKGVKIGPNGLETHAGCPAGLGKRLG